MTDPFASRPTSVHPTPETERASPGTVVGGRYTLRTAVGHGGMGTVWQATDSQLGRNVAVKEVVPPPGIAPEDRDAMYQRMLREARAAAGLSHPGIVQVYDVVTDAGRPWVVMELLEARSLSDVVLQDGPLAPRAVAKIGVALLGALEVAHAAGVLHRDVKPANVLICTDGRCVLTDFGVARMPSDQQLTTPGMVLGSPHFISPERAMGAAFGPPSDLFSLGVTLYTAVEGRPPFDKSEPIATMHSVVEDPTPPPRRASVLTNVLYGLLEKDPEQRWDASTARQALRDLLAGPLASTSLQFPTDPYAVVPAQRQSRENPTRPAAGTASQIGGRALLAPGEDPTRRAGSSDRTGATAYRPASTSYQDDGDSTAAFPAVTDNGAATGALDSPTAPVRWVDRTGYGEPTDPGSRTSRAARRAGRPGTRDRAAAMAGQARIAAGRAGTAAGRAGARGLATVRALPRQAQVAAAAGLAMVVLITGVWLFAGGDEDSGLDQVAAPEPSGGPPADEPLIEAQEYAGRGVVLNIPASWQPGPDNPDLSYIDFVDPADARVQVRLVVEQWGSDAHRLVEVAEESIRSNPSCAEPYQRLDLADLELTGRPGALLEYTCGEGADQRRARWATVVQDGTAYSVRLTVPVDLFEDHQPVYEELIRSFRLASD